VEIEQVFDNFLRFRMNILLGEFNANVGRENFSNRQLGMRGYIGMVMIMVLE
jgi:hypothetical protein